MKIRLLLIISLFSISMLSADEFVEDGTTTLGGYGELHYDMEANDGDGKLDFHRFIFYIKHQFNENWSLMSEVEIEHNMIYTNNNDDDDDGVVDADADSGGGYIALEQAYLNYWNGNWGFKGGVVLVPAGITNEYHEPPTFMSVERPEYNKYVIPTTWFDNGFAFYGNMGDVNWNFTMTGDLNGDAIGDGIKSARMKGVGSKTSDWTKTLQLSWVGMEGLKVGGSITMNDAPTSAVIAADTYNTYSQVYNEATQTWDTVTETVDAVIGQAASSIGIQLTEVNLTWAKNNLYARFENGKIDYDNNLSAESTSGYYLDLGYNIADLVGCDDKDLYVWTRISSYNKDDDDPTKENNINLFGVTYKPLDKIAIKFEMGNHEKYGNYDNNSSTPDTMGDVDIIRMGLGYIF